MTTGIYFHPKFIGNSWPIIGNRYENFTKLLKELEDEMEEVKLFRPQPVSEKYLLSTHTKEHIKREKESWYFEGASLTVGACMEASKKVWKNQLKNAVVFMVTAGHHAHPDHAWGGTYLSCMGPIAAALEEDSPRIAYIDTDSHHGRWFQGNIV